MDETQTGYPATNLFLPRECSFCDERDRTRMLLHYYRCGTVLGFNQTSDQHKMLLNFTNESVALAVTSYALMKY